MSSSIYNAVFGPSNSTPRTPPFNIEKRNLSDTSINESSPDGQGQPEQPKVEISLISSPLSGNVHIHVNKTYDIAKMLRNLQARFYVLDNKKTRFSTGDGDPKSW